MKSSRITLSIALLFSLPARVHAADNALPVGLPVAESSQNSIVNFHNALLADASDSVLTRKDGLNALVASQNRRRHNSEDEHATLVSGDYTWQRIEGGERPKYIVKPGAQLMAQASIMVPTAVEFYHQTLHELDGVLIEHKAAVLADLKQDSPQTNFNSAVNYLWQRVEIDGRTTYVPLADGASLAESVHYQHMLAHAWEEDIQNKEAIVSIIALQNPETNNSAREQELFKFGNYSWQPVKNDGARTTYIVQSNGAYIEEETEQPVSETSAAIEESSSGWISRISNALPTLPALFTSASTSKEPVKSVFVPVLQGILQELDTKLVLGKDSVVKAVPRAAYIYKNGVATIPLNNDNQAGWECVATDNQLTGEARIALKPSRACIQAYYKDTAVTKEILQHGIISTKLAQFNKTTAERAIARQGNSLLDQQKLFALVKSREICLEGNEAVRPGLKLLSALAAKTAEQRNKVLVQLRATESALNTKLKATRAKAFAALNQAPHYDLIFNLSALANCLAHTYKNFNVSESSWASNLLGMFAGAENQLSGLHSSVAGFAEGAIDVYNSWRTSHGEPADATALRAETKLISNLEAALAYAQERKIGHLIDRYTIELAEHRERQEKLFAQLQNQVIEATRAVLLTDKTLLKACTHIGQLQKPLAHLKTVIADESNADIKQLASMLVLLSADSREAHGVTFDAIRGLLGSSASRADLTRQKQNAKERTTFKVVSQDPDYYFVRDTLVPAVDAAVAEQFEAANKPTYAQAAASSSSDAPKSQPKHQPKKNTGKGKGKSKNRG